MSSSDQYQLAELERRLNNLLSLGTIAATDYPAARVKVQSGDMLTGWIPWLTRRSSNDSDWWAPEVGEQVMLLAPGGDPAQGVALPAVYQDAHPAPANRETVRRIEFADGGFVQYDRASGELAINVVGHANITVGGKTTLISQATVDMDGGSGELLGAVQGHCLCAFTGKRHPHISPTIRQSF